ncbi:kinase-like domain-containing protein [Gloeopeniophorella convolvens]|nr:kinase-like domain-containing protein [Gloeopeniophorella convolvens]
MLLSPPSPSPPHHFPSQPPPPQPSTSSSARSHLSVITTPSASFTSLENYTYSPTSESSSPPSEPSPSSKTSAFFGSPFESSPQSSCPTHPVPSVSKTAAFFSSPFTDFPTPPPQQSHTPREIPSSSRSLTADFFSASAFSSRPTPPPSLRSSTSNASLRTTISRASSPNPSYATLPPEYDTDSQATPIAKPHIPPPLARLFPSRYSTNPRRTDGLHPRSPRGFVVLEVEQPDDVLIASPLTIEVPRLSELPKAVPLVEESYEDVYTAGSLVHPDNDDEPSYELVKQIGQGAFSHVWLGRATKADNKSSLVAVKMISRAGERAGAPGRRAARGERASFLREVEVLHYLTPVHASLPQLHASFTVRTHHVLVLEYASGGELLDVVNSDEQHARLSEALLRRMWCELVGAVEWMHSRYVVHRDIKLENILLTCDPFAAPPPADTPLIKLTDFGLARMIDPANPWLRTRCGSESYAAPELLVAAHADEPAVPLSRTPSEAHEPPVPAHTEPEPGTYDGRATDAWALGVVLFALATRALPFDAPPASHDADSERARRRWVLRVVRGEWAWPAPEGSAEEAYGELCGAALARCAGARSLVARLLVSDPRRRARVGALWDEPWMRGAS